MKACFVLLLDRTLHNVMRKMAYELHRDYRLGFRGAMVPPHISLKQPFHIDDVAALEVYFDAFAASIAPFDVALDGVETLTQLIGPDGDTGLVWVAVRESPTLRGLHNRLNAELAERFANTAADFDGPKYRFHATIAAAGQPSAVYERVAAALQPPDLPPTCHIDEILMCYSDDDDFTPGHFITYKTLPLSHNS